MPSPTITRRAPAVLGAALAVSLLAGGAAAAHPAASATGDPLPLGPSGLPEDRVTHLLEQGVTHTRIVRGRTAPTDRWTVTVGFAQTTEERAALEAQLRRAGFDPRSDAAAEPAPDGSPLGWMVRTGAFVEQADAEALAERVRAAGLPASVQNTGEDGGPAQGPWVVNVLTVDPDRYRGHLRAELATDVVPGTETTSSIAARLDATAAVNGGFFVVNDSLGTTGDLAGISVVEGELVSEAVDGRPAFVLPRADGRRASIDRLSTQLLVRGGDGARRVVDGLNRKPGLIVNCGGIGDEPFDRPAHDFVCRDDDELILVTPAFGAAADEGPGFQVTVDGRGRVVHRQAYRGGRVPADGMLLQATGTTASWLRRHAALGERLRVTERVTDEHGRAVVLHRRGSIVNGGPTLVEDGRVSLDPAPEGWSPEDIAGADRAGFFNAWYVRRNPRTAAGIRSDGTIVLVTVDGRAPGHSIGTSIRETARLLEHFGAEEGINLDGGGSTAMVVEDRLQVRPSDPAGERPVGDALVLLSRRTR